MKKLVSMVMVVVLMVVSVVAMAEEGTVKVNLDKGKRVDKWKHIIMTIKPGYDITEEYNTDPYVKSDTVYVLLVTATITNPQKSEMRVIPGTVYMNGHEITAYCNTLDGDAPYIPPETKKDIKLTFRVSDVGVKDISEIFDFRATYLFIESEAHGYTHETPEIAFSFDGTDENE